MCLVTLVEKINVVILSVVINYVSRTQNYAFRVPLFGLTYINKPTVLYVEYHYLKTVF